MRNSVWIIAVVCGLGLIFSPAEVLAQKKAARASISIQNSRYNPGKVSIKTGDTVVWSNNDDRDHTVVANDGSFASGTIKPGKSFSHTFRKAGAFSFSCRLHPRMKGTVSVD